MKTARSAPLILLLLLTASLADAAPLSITREDQREVMVTIYNGNLGLVKDVREVRLPAGTTEVRFMDVAAQIDPTTVHLQLADGPGRAQDPRAELRVRPAVEREAPGEVRRQDRAALPERRDLSRGHSCSPRAARSSRSTARSTWATTAAWCCPRCPRTWWPSPRWSGCCATRPPAAQRVEASYLTGGITWKADYVMVLNAADDRADLTGWVTIDNKSGATYGNAALKLVAGDVNRAQDARRDGPDDGGGRQGRQSPRRRAASSPPRASSSTTSTRSTAGPRSRTARPSSSRCMSGERRAGAASSSIYYGAAGLLPERVRHADLQPEGGGPSRGQEQQGEPARRAAAQGQGARLQGGRGSGSQQFIGEDWIDHTPKDERVKIKLGERLRRGRRAHAEGLAEARPATSTRSSGRSRCATTRRRTRR